MNEHEAVCQSKERFESHGAASLVARKRGMRAKSYKCSVCHAFHLTKKGMKKHSLKLIRRPR